MAVDKVSNNDNYNNGLMSNNSSEIKNVVLECKVVSRESVDEVMSVCVCVCVCVCVESLEGWQRVQFFRGVKGGEERSSRRYWVEKCSTSNCFLKFFVVPGESRKSFNVAVPSAWSERENVIWCCDERKRQIKIFEINRGYERLVQVLDIERDEKSELHYEIERDEYLDKTVINDKITYLMLTNTTDGDGTKIPNLDQVYEMIKGNNPIKYNGTMTEIEKMGYNNNNNNNKLSVSKNEKCYKKLRLLHDDEGWIKKSVYGHSKHFSLWLWPSWIMKWSVVIWTINDEDL